MTLPKLKPLDRFKSKLQELYAQHEQTQLARAELHAKHAKVFAKDRELTNAIEMIQDGIKSIVRKFYDGKPSGTYEDFHGALYTVKVTSKYSTEIDADGLLSAMPQLRAVPGVVVTTIDRTKIKAMIETGQISAEIVGKYTTTKPMTAAVSFAPSDQVK